MSNTFNVGDVIQGKVTSVKPYGAFIALDETHTGLVHISQVAHAYIKDINEVLKVGDEVTAKIISIDETNGKISLSIRETLPEPVKTEERPREHRQERPARNFKKEEKNEGGFNTLEDKIKEWLKHSQEVQHELNKRSNNR